MAAVTGSGSPLPAPRLDDVTTLVVVGVPVDGRLAHRQCSRPACAEPATATLAFRYERASAWLDILTPERDPHAYDLCERHAARVSVPRGWRYEDRRHPAVRPAPPVDDPERLAG